MSTVSTVSTGLSLRPFVASDDAEVTSWFADAGELRFFAGRRLKWPLDSAQWDLLRADPDVSPWSAVIDGDPLPVGHGELVAESASVVRFARIAVRPSERGHGYGRTVVELMIRKAVEGRYDSATLFVHPDNTVAIRGYRGLGFSPVADPEAGHRMRMRLDLLSAPLA